MRSLLPWFAVIGGIALIAFVLRDAFETMILPRRLNGRFRFTHVYYRRFWPLWARATDGMRNRRRRETLLSLFGPLSMLLLFVIWAIGLVVGFALIYMGLGSPLQTSEPLRGMGMDLYLSGSLFLTLGIGNVAPQTMLGRGLALLEGGMGFGFVAVIISYLPVLYGGFSRRETNISMLDARAGSPPTASELLRRHAGEIEQLRTYLAEWERWSAELLESQISYPVLGYFRSQHVNQSWLASLTTMLDSCAFLMASGEDCCTRQAQITFAMARHAVVDLAQVYISALPAAYADRLPAEEMQLLYEQLRDAGLPVKMDEGRAARLGRLRRLYEPHVAGIGQRLRLELPRWIGDPDILDNWQRSPWDRAASAAIGRLEKTEQDTHF